MKFYSFEEIKRRGEIPGYLQSLGTAERGGRWCRPWQSGSDSFALAVSQEADGSWSWYDHVDKDGGSILDLATKVHGGDQLAAQEALGEWLGLEPRPVREAEPSRRIVRVYDYADATGTLVHQTVRYEPKDFRQRRPDGQGGWVWSLKGIEPVLYGLPAVLAARTVVLCEGEKDADRVAELGYTATTAPMGAKYWRDSFSEALRGRNVVLVPDNDAAGASHLETVAGALHGVAAALKVLRVPAPHKDVHDWLEAVALGQLAGHHEQGDRGAFRDAVNSSPRWEPTTVATPVAVGVVPALAEDPTHFDPADYAEAVVPFSEDAQARTRETAVALQAARLANAEPFRNYQVVTVKAGKREKEQKRPRLMRELVADVFQRFHGFPRRVGDSLFDMDHDTGAIRWLNTPPELVAWIGEKSRQPVEWGQGEGMARASELHASIHANARVYNAISATPTWPRRDDVYYTHGELPAPSADGEFFEDFCSFFEPATEMDRALIRVFVASCLYYRLEATRPLWVIDSTTGQESGKSTLVQMVARLIGGDLETQAPVVVTHKQLQHDNSGQVIWKRVLSQSGRRKRILLIDNVTGRFACPELATMITLPAVTGMAPYGRGEETRPNDLTYTLTANTASLDRDLTSRAVFIQLRRASRDAGWARKLTDYISQYRLQIIADIVALMERPVEFDFTPSSRFEVWESEVAIRVIRDLGVYDAIWRQNEDRKVYSDSEREEAELIHEHLEDALRQCGLDPDTDVVWLQSDVATRIAEDAVPVWRGKSGSTMQKLRQLAKNASLAQLSAEWEVYPHHGKNRRRGLCWNLERYKASEGLETVHVLAVREGKIGRVSL